MTENKLRLNFLAGVQVENDIFFSAWNTNGLFKYNPQTEQCDFLKCFPGEGNWGVHSEAILYQNTIWFIPRGSERIAIVDLESLSITYLDLPEYGYRPKGVNIPSRRMIGCHERGEKFLWLIPYAYRLFIKIDMDKRQIIEVQEWSNDEFAGARGVRVRNKLWVNIYSSKEIRVINLESGEQLIKKIEHEDTSYVGIQNIGENILLFPVYTKDGVSILDYDMNEKNIVHLDDNGQCYYEFQALTKEDDILLVPYSGNQCVCIHVEDDCCFIKELKNLEVEENAYCSAKLIYDEQIWFLSHVTENPIICYEKQGDTLSYRHIAMERKKYNEDVARAITEYGVEYSPFSLKNMHNDSILSLDNFIYFVERAECKEKIDKEELIGENIYKLLR